MLSTLLLAIITLNFSFNQGDARQDGFTFWWGTGNGVYENSVNIPNAEVQFGNAMEVKFKRAIDFGTKTSMCFAVSAYNQGGSSGKSLQTTDSCYKAPSAPNTVKATP